MRPLGLTTAAMLVSLLLAVSVCAAVDIDASLNRDTIRVGEISQLTIAVSGTVTGVGEPVVPQLTYLTVVSSSSQKSIELIGGQMRSTTTYTFGLRASREGTYEIPPIEVPVDDMVLTTRPLTLNVVPIPSGEPRPSPRQPPDYEMIETDRDRPRPGPEIDARMEVDRRNPWVGQQVTLTLIFTQSHLAPLIGNAEYTPPATPGLVAEPLPDDGQETVWIEGVPHEIATRKTALIAPAPGEHTIGPAHITFRRSYMRGEERITTDPITLRVRQLPQQGRPDDFSGVVGRLQARISSATDQVKVGEAISLRVEVEGTGDLRQLEAPRVTVDRDARVDPGGADREISPQRTPSGYLLGGTVSFHYLIVPRETGPLTVNPVTLHFFNPDSGRYESVQTSGLTIDVQPGDLGQVAVQDHGPELRYIKEGRRGLQSRAPVTASAWFWGAQLLPLLALGWAFRTRAEMRRRELDPRYRRRVEAVGEARDKLGDASRIGDTLEVFRRADDALAGYIGAKTGHPAAAISPATAVGLLMDAGADEGLARRSADLLEQLRAGAYAPGSGEQMAPRELLERVQKLIGELEGALR